VRKRNAYSRLRADAAAGHVRATYRLKSHVLRRAAQGWRRDTIAKRIGISLAQVNSYLDEGATPRLVRTGNRAA
jgi:hypothetical protein